MPRRGGARGKKREGLNSYRNGDAGPSRSGIAITCQLQEQRIFHSIEVIAA